jgi:hypothetical protein
MSLNTGAHTWLMKIKIDIINSIYMRKDVSPFKH